MSKILIVEDEESIADLEKDYLELSGFEVEIENQGDTGLVRAIKEDFDLLILDLMLPGRSGLEILSALRADPGFAGLPVMMLTAKGQGRDREAAEKAGANLFMAKPFSNAEFVAAARSLLPADGPAA